MSITVKLINGTSKEVSVPDFNVSVADLKKLTADVIEIPADEQRVVLRGKVLKDADILTACGMESGCVVHIVKSKKKTTEAEAPKPTTAPPPAQAPSVPASTPSAEANPYAALSGWGNAGATNNAAPNMNPGGFGGMPQMDMQQTMQMMQDPFTQQMMQEISRNPELLRQMMQMNPQTANMPPEMMQMAMQMMQNPQMMQMMMGMANGGAAPGAGAGGFGAGMGNNAQSGGFPPFNPAAFAPPPPQGNPREIYREQLQQLREMGFPNEDANIAALQQSQGNLSFAIERLFSA
ncbi:ubiquilin [Angomonas deanei]|nr:ubiquilin [Angomonas deanei]|eukprot:EPY17871.1 ubiquilin [Angomonas deanei]